MWPEQLREAPDGSIWAINNKRLIRFGTDGTWRREPTPSSSAAIGGIFVDSTSTLWIAQDGFLHRRPLSQASYIRTEVPTETVTGFAETPSGNIWINDYDDNASLNRTQQVSRTGHRVRMLPQSRSTGATVASAADGSLIVASFNAGLRRFSAEQTPLRSDHRSSAEPDVFTREHGLSSNATRAVMVDSHGNIWIGGARGLDRLRPAQLTELTRHASAAGAGAWGVCASKRGEMWAASSAGELYRVSARAGAPLLGMGDPLFSLACADGGHAWFANSRGVWAVASGRITALPPITGAHWAQIKVVAASDHTLYALVLGPAEAGNGVWQYRDGQWTKLPGGELGAPGYAAYMDGRDRLWIGDKVSGRVILHTSAGTQTFASGEPGLGYVYAFLDTSRGLFAGGTNGMAVLRDSRFEMLAFVEPSFARGVRGLVEARDGDLWLNSASGFAHIPGKELEAALAQPMYPMKATLIREGDFAGASQGSLEYLDSAARDSDGRLWFATRNGVVHLDPERTTASNHPPIVTIRSMVADGQLINDNRVLAPATRRLEIQYFGVNLTTPENVIYRYRLEGFDESWREAGSRTEAFYTRLPPATYTFSVMASNGDGVWTAAVNSAPFTVLPSFYQTRWFAAAVVGFAVLIAGTIHRLRVQQISRAMTARYRELDEREREARLVVNTIPGLVASLTPAGEVAVVNDQLVEYCGQGLEAMRQWGTNGTVHPEDVPHVAGIFVPAIAAGQPYELEARVRRFDGVYRWFQIRGLPLRDTNGQVARWYSLLSDIDDRKRAEVQLRQAYDSVVDAQRLSKTGSFITDLVGDDHNWSDEAFRIFEFDPATKVTLQRVREVIHAADLPAFQGAIARAMTGGDVSFAFRIVTSGGAVKHVRGVAHVMERSAGRPMFVGALQDVTESIVAEEALNRARTEFAHVARLTTMGELTASIAHEVKQPIAAAVTSAQTALRWLEAQPPELGEVREALSRTVRAGKRAGDVIGQIRALVTKAPPRKDSVEINAAIREIVELTQGEAANNGVSLRTDLAEDLPLIVGDRVQLQQVLLNLIMNGIEAMAGMGEVPRDLLISSRKGDAKEVLVAVADTGPGLAAGALDQMFAAFYTTKPGGLGLGLSICRSIIEAHDGRLWASANEPRGTVFQFTLPASLR